MGNFVDDVIMLHYKQSESTTFSSVVWLMEFSLLGKCYWNPKGTVEADILPRHLQFGW